jgi:hypothetical protein
MVMVTARAGTTSLSGAADTVTTGWAVRERRIRAGSVAGGR